MDFIKCLLATSLLLFCTEAPAQNDGTQAALDDLENSLIRAIEKAGPSVVAIARIPFEFDRLERLNARNPFGRDDAHPDPLSSSYIPRDFGTGLILAAPDQPNSRFVLTCYHVVKGGQPFHNNGTIRSEARIMIRFDQRNACWATIYAADPRSDLAVLHFNPTDLMLSASDLPVMELAPDETLKKGQFVISLGNPYAIARDGSPSASFGMISNISRFPFNEGSRDRPTIHHSGQLLHVDTRLNPGTSGGALLNRSGQLVGITTSLAALEGYESSAGYAIPTGQGMRRIIDDLLRGLEIEYGFLGVEPASGGRRFGFGLIARMGQANADVEIVKVMPDSPSHRARLQTGDVLLTVDGQPIHSRDDLFREVGLKTPGSTVLMKIRRNGAERDVSVQLARSPEPSSELIIASNDRYPIWRGLKIGWSTSHRKDVNYDAPYPRAVIVERVDSDSPAASMQIREGDLIESVNGKPVETPAEFLSAVAGLNGDARLKLTSGREVILRSK